MFSKVFCRATLRACVFKSILILFFVVINFCNGFELLSDCISLITLESCVWWSIILYAFMLFFHGWFVL